MKKNLITSICFACATFSFILMSCGKGELTMEEQIAEDEKVLTDTEKQLLHQTPQFSEGLEETSYYWCRQKIQETYTEEAVDGWIIRKDVDGRVTRVQFEDISVQQPPADGKAFLVKFFGEEAAAQFVKADYAGRPENVEYYVQLCGDLEVSSYAFVYDEQGIMRSAGGAYYPTNDLSPNPTISSYAARMIFASHLDITVLCVNEKTRVFVELIPEGEHLVPRLVYSVVLNHGKGVIIDDHVAWIDAHSGRLLRVFFIG